MKLIAFWMFLIASFSSHAFSQTSEIKPVIVGDTFAQQAVVGHAHFIEVQNQSLSAADIINLSVDDMEAVNNKAMNFGTSSNEFYIHFNIKNTSSDDKHVVINMAYSPMDHVSFYFFDKQQRLIKSVATGDMLKFSSRDIASSSFASDIIIDPNNEYSVVVKVASAGNIIVPLTISDAEDFFNFQHITYFIFGLLLGVLFITGIYNFLVYWRTDEKLFGYFSLFVISFALLIIQQTGFGMEFLWSNFPAFNQFFAIGSITLACLGHIAFSLRFLQPEQSRYYYLWSLGAVSVACSLLTPIVPYSNLIMISLINGTLVLVSTLILGIRLAVAGSSSARLYALAWSPFLIGTTMTAAVRFELVQYNIVTEFSGLFFAIVTTVWLSMAIAERITKERERRMNAQKQAIDNLRLYEDLFDNSVAGFFTLTQNFQLIQANKSLVQTLGYDSKTQLLSALEDNFRSLFSNPDSLDILMQKMQKNRAIVDYEIELLKQNGDSFWASVSLRLSKINSDYMIEGALIDITARKLSEIKLNYLASHDPLTNLFNRREFERLLDKSIEDKHKQQLTVLYMDLDQFKVVNDTCGHGVGDQLLIELSQTMVKALDRAGIIARLGGDEFGVILPRLQAKEAYAVAEKLRTAITDFEFIYQDRIFSLGVSIGLVEVQNMRSTADIMSFADTACYAAKDAGRNRIHEYSTDNIELMQRREEMEVLSEINGALSQNGFALYRQKIVRNNDKRHTASYEILLRMIAEDGSAISPVHFIPSAERYGLMQKVDMYVVEHTLKWLSQNRSELNTLDYCAINLSGQSVGSSTVAKHIKECFDTFKIPHDKICFEITETHAVSNIQATQKFIHDLRSLGCKFALDDFGTGLSSYAYLKTLSIDIIKIDGCFVREIASSKADLAMVRSIHTVAKEMGKLTVAEFVESDEVIEKLKEVGVDYLQGYAIDKPTPLHYESIKSD